MRILLGGFVMFVWTSIAYMALPLAETGINEIPNESAVLNAMQSSMGDKIGLYIFSGSRRWQKGNARGKERGDETEQSGSLKVPSFNT